MFFVTLIWIGKSKELSLFEREQLLYRSCSVMVHELLHMLGIDHCIYFAWFVLLLMLIVDHRAVPAV